MKKLKIMHIVQSPGGVERYLKMFFKNIDRGSFENILVCSHDYNIDKYESLVDSFEYVKMQREISLFKDILAIFKVRKLIKKYKPDIVYTHSSKAGTIGRIANIAIKNKSVYNAHGWAFNISSIGIKRSLYLNIEKMMAKLTDSIVAISDYEKKSAIMNNICLDEKIKIIYNGIDKKEHEESKIISKSDIGIPENSYVIGCVGRLSRQKAPDIFIHAAKKINDLINNAYFVMVGDGEERKNIEVLVKEYGLENKVLITGWVDNPTSYIRIFDQAMLLSRWEGFGLVLAEYMYAKKAIIATNVDAIPNVVIDKETGFLVDVDNVDQVVEYVYRIYNEGYIREQLIEKAYQRVNEKFTIDRVIEDHIKLFNDLVLEN